MQVLEAIAPPYTNDFVQLFLPMVENEEITGSMRGDGDNDPVSEFIGNIILSFFLKYILLVSMLLQYCVVVFFWNIHKFLNCHSICSALQSALHSPLMRRSHVWTKLPSSTGSWLQHQTLAFSESTTLELYIYLDQGMHALNDL